MRGALLAGCVLAALLLLPSARLCAQETTQEIIVGYNSEQDRRDAEKELVGARDKLKVRGQSLESLQVQVTGPKTLKLQVGLPPAAKAEIARAPEVETSIIQGLADQLKQSDKRIAYAHPNWIMRGLPPGPRAGTVPTAPQPAAAPPRRETSAAVPRKHAKRVAHKRGKRLAKAVRQRKRHLARRHMHRRIVVAQRRCRCWHEVAWRSPCGF